MPWQVERFVIMCIALLPHKYIAADEPPPDGDFLEYLALMVEEDGEYLDLMDLTEVEDLPEATPTALPEKKIPANKAAVEVAP